MEKFLKYGKYFVIGGATAATAYFIYKHISEKVDIKGQTETADNETIKSEDDVPKVGIKDLKTDKDTLNKENDEDKSDAVIYDEIMKQMLDYEKKSKKIEDCDENMDSEKTFGEELNDTNAVFSEEVHETNSDAAIFEDISKQLLDHVKKSPEIIAPGTSSSKDTMDDMFDGSMLGMRAVVRDIVETAKKIDKETAVQNVENVDLRENINEVAAVAKPRKEKKRKRIWRFFKCFSCIKKGGDD